MYKDAVISIGFPFKVYLTMESIAKTDEEFSDFEMTVKFVEYKEAEGKTREEVAKDTDVIIVKNNTIKTEFI